MSRIAGLITPKAPSTFTVTLKPTDGYYYGTSDSYIGYSLDGGTTWTDLKSTVTSDIVLSNVDEIKFKAVCSSFTPSLTRVGTTDGGNEIVQGERGSTVYSNNITITMNTMYYIRSY